MRRSTGRKDSYFSMNNENELPTLTLKFFIMFLKFKDELTRVKYFNFDALSFIFTHFLD